MGNIGTKNNINKKEENKDNIQSHTVNNNNINKALKKVKKFH